MGKSAALKTCFDAALQNEPGIIITMDTDGQHEPAEIPKLAAPILAGDLDIVIGSRYMEGNVRRNLFIVRNLKLDDL